jgi:regulator of protease activity HflC (stomatin/prohibitin superfamily)
MKKTLQILAILFIAILGGSWLTLRMLTVYVPLGHVGVRTQEYAILGEKGVVKKDYGPGWHRDLGPIDSWNLFDGTVQSLEMTRSPTQGSRRGRDDVQVQSADGYAVSVDVTVKYRIQEGNAHQLYQDTGGGERYKTIVRNEAEKACIALLGQMKTEDFYNPHERRDKSAEVRMRLADSLDNNFVEVIDVLIRDVQFDPEYEKKIRRKKLADQEVELNIAQAAAAEKRGLTQVIEAETEKKVKIIQKEKEAELIRMKAEADRKIARIKADYEKFATEMRADADLVAATMEAKGDLLIKTAEAKGERLRNQAMKGLGGGTIVALEAARNLNLSDVMVSTRDVDLLDVEKMATRLGLPPEEESAR